MAKMMSAKERNAKIIEDFRSGRTAAEIAAEYNITEARVSKVLSELAPDKQGVIFAEELSSEKRKELTAQAERDAGIAPAEDCCENPLMIAKRIYEAFAALDLGDAQVDVSRCGGGLVVEINGKGYSLTYSG